MEIKMTVSYNQALKRASYTCLTLTSLMLSLESYGEGPFNEEGEDVVKKISESIVLQKNIVEDLEKKPKLLFEVIGVHSKEEAQQDLKKAPQDRRTLKGEKAQDTIRQGKVTPIEYFKENLELLERASKNLSKKIPVHQWIESSSHEKGSSWE